MKGHGAKFERKQEEAIAALLTQRNIEEAAKAAGIAPNTLLNWMKLPEFQTAYREARHGVRPSHRTAPAGNLGGSHHLIEDDDRSGHAGIRASTGGRGNIQPRGQGHRDRGYRGARGGAGSSDNDWRFTPMKMTLLARVERLEALPDTGKPVFFRYGWLHALPNDFTGERHVAIVSREPTRTPNVEWCVFEERPGCGPPLDHSEAMTVFLAP